MEEKNLKKGIEKSRKIRHWSHHYSPFFLPSLPSARDPGPWRGGLLSSWSFQFWRAEILPPSYKTVTSTLSDPLIYPSHNSHLFILFLYLNV